jgi:F-type H+-transporting ATPase subunit delta
VADAAVTPYANALFEAADKEGSLERVHRDLGAFTEAVATSRDLSRALFNPSFPAHAKSLIVAKLTQGGEPLVGKALQVLLKNGRLGLLPDLQEAYDERYRARERSLAVRLTTAVAIDERQAESLRKQLEKATGQSVTLQRTVDAAIIGGVVLRVRDLLVDASVRRRLDALRRTLSKSKLPFGGEA